MVISAGLLIKFNDKILLCHPTNSSWIGTFSPPKGIVDDGESIIDGAIRETFEETSIIIDKNKISKEFIIEYNKGSKIYKKVHLFLIEIKSISEIGLTSELIPKEKLQLNEIDWAGFMTISEADKKIFWRFNHILKGI